MTRVKYFAAFALLLLLLFVVVLVRWAADVHDDRKHTVSINSPTLLFKGSGNDGCDRAQQLEIIQPGAPVVVRRIIYWKDCATIDVVLSNGQHGYIVFDNHISVTPALP
jgi:hypothetical protein